MPAVTINAKLAPITGLPVRIQVKHERYHARAAALEAVEMPLVKPTGRISRVVSLKVGDSLIQGAVRKPASTSRAGPIARSAPRLEFRDRSSALRLSARGRVEPGSILAPYPPGESLRPPEFVRDRREGQVVCRPRESRARHKGHSCQAARRSPAVVSSLAR